MKNLITILMAALTMVSCKEPSENQGTTTEKNDTVSKVAEKKEEVIDPVCGMIKDSTWTDFTVYKGDTVWFCAESEKKAFEANPKKYELSLKK